MSVLHCGRMRAALCLCVAGIAPVLAAEPRPTWECLPADTAAMVRIPRPAEFLEAVRTRTRFGAIALAEPRLEGAWKLLLDAIRTADADDDEDPVEQLAKLGLTPDDVRACFRGDMGAAVVLRDREGRPPVPVAIAWLEPGAETATRLVEAWRKHVADRNAAGELDAPRRVDLELAGHEVTWFVEPVMTVDANDLDLDDLGDAPDEKAVQKRIEEIRTRVRDAKLVKVGQTHTFLARLDGRLLVATTMTSGLAMPAEGEDRDFDAESGSEEVRSLVERLLADHAAAGESPLADALRLPGMERTLPGGIALVDVIVDPRVLVDTFTDGGQRDRMLAALDGMGVKGMGPLAWRQSLDDGRYESGMFLSLPAPRKGLMGILDQPCDAVEIPSFVTREAIDLTQISLDLGAAYKAVKEVFVTQGGPETANLATAVEMQAQGWLGIELPKLLSAFGTRHWIVSYPPRLAETIAEVRRVQDRGNDGVPGQQVVDRLAVVWRIDDEAPFATILQRLAGLAEGDVQEEQGFRGVRMPDGPAVFMGQGHLVVAIGDDSLEKTLAAIRNPPAGEASLRESDVLRRAGDLLPLEAARMAGVSDSTRSGGTLGMLRDLMAAMTPDDIADEGRDLLAALQKLLPSAAEMEGMFGVGATTLRADDDGVAIRSAWEMPAP